MICYVLFIQIEETVQNSSKNGHNIPQLVDDENKPVVFYDWKSYLKTYFKPLKNISQYHHFMFESANPVHVKFQVKALSEIVTFSLLRSRQNLPSDLPGVLSGIGLDAARQWHLFENIRESCYSDSSKDLVCPKPVVPKNEIDLTKENSQHFKHKPVVPPKKALLN